MGQPPWLEEAWAEFGQHEIAGAGNNTRITAFMKELGHATLARDSVPWCAAFVGASLERAGIASTRSLMARSYLKWGEKLSDARVGSIVVLTRGSDPAAGHVGFFVGESEGRLILLGGNQGDQVSVAAFAKSRLLGFRWPAFSGQGVPAVSSDDFFERALAHVLKMEGGYTDDPVDPGGATNKGITIGVLAAWKKVALNDRSRPGLTEELKAISDSTVSEIYRERYWRLALCAQMPAGLAFMHFDAAVNHGVTGAARLLQQALRVSVDGEIGPETKGAIMRLPVLEILQRYAEMRRVKYKSLPHFWRFGRGWLRRVEETLGGAIAVAGEDAPGLGRAQDSRLDADGNGARSMSETTVTKQDGSGNAAPKWWGESLTVWGAFITAAATVLPIIGQLLGFEITGDLVRQIGSDVFTALQILGGVVGTLMTLYGRARASQPLERRPVQLML